jgi:hypothetical protein
MLLVMMIVVMLLLLLLLMMMMMTKLRKLLQLELHFVQRQDQKRH